MVTVKVNDKDLQMEVDTGASASVISEEVYGRLWKREDASPLRPTTVTLRTYTGEKLALLGSITVDVQYKEQRQTLSLLVVAGSGPTLLCPFNIPANNGGNFAWNLECVRLH